MALVQRFTTITQGAMVLTGNALSVRTSINYPPYANDFTNGAYITTDLTTIAAPGFPNGTTFEAKNNSSSAILNLPSNSTVLYAQLFWMISIPVEDINASIRLGLPTSTTTIVAPNVALTQAIGTRIWQAQDVTTIVNTAGSGTYTAFNVPGDTIVDGISKMVTSWYLLVVYKNQSMPFRYFNVNTGLAFSGVGVPSDITFTGFSTPSSGTVNGYLLTSDTAGELTDMAQIWVGSNLAAATSIGNTSIGTWNGASPYAQVNSMLPANILIADTNDSNIGMLDTRGTLGSYNKDPFEGTAPPYARVSTDIFGASISNKLTNNQSTLFTRITYETVGSSLITSQSVQVDINSANLGNITKTVNKKYAISGEVLEYTVVLKNTGLVNAESVVFMDTIPSNTSFVDGSVNINGMNLPLANPQQMTLGLFTPNTLTTIKFKVKVTSTIPSDTISNKSQVTYNFLPGGEVPRQYTDAISNAAVTTLVDATITKSASPSIVRAGETITYTNVYNFINAPNTTSNIVFQDTIPANTTFVPNSVVVNGTTMPGVSPNPPGFTVLFTPPPTVITINFNVVANTITQTTTISNTSTGRYIFNNGVGNTTIGTNSTIVNTIIDPFNATMTKYVDKNFVDVNDTITYTIAINNAGTTLNNVIFNDTIPTGTSIVADSFVDGDTVISGANPNIGVMLSPIGANSTRTVTFKVKVNTISAPNPILNSATTKLNYTLFTLNDGSASINSGIVYATISTVTISATKIVDKNSANIGDILTYIIPITNYGTTITNTLQFSDKIPPSLAIVPKSFKQDGVLKYGTLVYPGLTLTNIPPNTTSTITFKVKIINPVPSKKIINSATISYSYISDPNKEPNKARLDTNTVLTSVNMADLSSIRKRVDKTDAMIDDILTYTITISNTGNLDATKVVLLDKLSRGAIFLQGSVTVDGVAYPNANPMYPGVDIGTLSPNKKVIITFKVKVIAVLPPPCEICNIAKVNYHYLSGDVQILASSNSNTIITELASPQIPTKKEN